MLRDNLWYNFGAAAVTEVMQCLDEGRDAAAYMAEAREIDAMELGSPERLARLGAFLDRMALLPDPGSAAEPSTYPEILAARGPGRALPPCELDREALWDRIYGAWLGRFAGNLLGKPIEGMSRPKILRLAQGTNNYPFDRYISSEAPEEVLRETGLLALHGNGWDLIDKLDHCPADDDTSYTVLSLKLVEQKGRDFQPEDVGEAWLANIPALNVCTAEHAAYLNLMNKRYPPESATYHNPYREWVGAQIRTDFYGYICPGDPERAAGMGFRDGAISHVRNGLYGGMWVSAMNAAAFCCGDAEELIEQGLAQVPAGCRLARDVRRVIGWHRQGLPLEDAIAKIYEQYPENGFHNAVHTLSNAMIVALGLLYGEGDFARSIGIAVVAGYDTDSNGATVGSIAGLMTGGKRMPARFVEPLRDTVDTSVMGYNRMSIRELADRTLALLP